MYKLMIGNRTILDNTRTGYVGYVQQSGPILPNDMDFIYQAKDFDGSKIPNKAPNSTFGDYLEYGTLTLNGSGANAYLTNGLTGSNYLYKDLTTTELNNMKAVSSTYTFFFRVLQEQSGMGGIISWRNGSSYIYMIRVYNYQVQIHTNTGTDLGDNFRLDTDRVYKVVVNGSSFKAYNLDNNAEYSLTYSTNRTMTSRMATFAADLSTSSEASLSRFYAIAGIPRSTTSEEDQILRNCLTNQSA